MQKVIGNLSLVNGMKCIMGMDSFYGQNPTTSFFMDRDRSVKIDRTMRYRLDLLSGKADIRDGKGIYLQIRIEIPDTL